MPADPQLLVYTMAGVVGGLMLFALLLLSGTVLIRWLALPQDLPEGPRFEPPPPPSVLRGDRAAARATAQVQARLGVLYAQAHALVQGAAECQELHQQVRAAGAHEPFLSAGVVTERCSATAVTGATEVERLLAALDQRLRSDRTAVGDDDIKALHQQLAGHAVVIQGAQAQARAAVAPLPQSGNRRLLLLVGLLVVMILWVVVMQSLLRR